MCLFKIISTATHLSHSFSDVLYFVYPLTTRGILQKVTWITASIDGSTYPVSSVRSGFESVVDSIHFGICPDSCTENLITCKEYFVGEN